MITGAVDANASIKARDANLDLLRATAIGMVVVYHVAQRWPVSSNIAAVSRYGAYGVDLFFVLSGWLIGGLFWRERAGFGDVEIHRFIFRRALRTVPPYMAALTISYLGVFLVRREPFDAGYLVFAQNYYDRIPFFLVSWSLCIEEHFYVAMPFVALAASRWSSRPDAYLLTVSFVPAVMRALVWPAAAAGGIGYFDTATHLRYEGLALGVWASCLRHTRPGAWLTLRRISPGALGPALLLVAASASLSGRLRYATFYLAMSVWWVLLLVSLVDRPPRGFARSRAVFWIATTSYSVYLTHAFTLDIALRVLSHAPPWPAVRFGVIAALVAMSGALFYRCVEAPTLAFRARLLPGRIRRLPRPRGRSVPEMEPQTTRTGASPCPP